jgi:hypothetical protein
MKKHIREKYDVTGDGNIDLELKEKILKIENDNQKQDAQRRMAWAAILGILGYALIPLIPFIPVERLEILASISDLYFLSLASVVGMFFGAQAYMSKNQ